MRTASIVLASTALIAVVSACGGNGSSPTVFPSESPTYTAVIVASNNACNTSYTVHRDGTAQRVVQSCGSGTLDETLPATVTSKLFADLQAAQPLDTLPQALTVDTSTTIAWDSQQSPNIAGNGNAIEQSLTNDAGAVTAAFPAR